MNSVVVTISQYLGNSPKELRGKQYKIHNCTPEVFEVLDKVKFHDIMHIDGLGSFKVSYPVKWHSADGNRNVELVVF